MGENNVYLPFFLIIPSIYIFFFSHFRNIMKKQSTLDFPFSPRTNLYWECFRTHYKEAICTPEKWNRLRTQYKEAVYKRLHTKTHLKERSLPCPKHTPSLPIQTWAHIKKKTSPPRPNQHQQKSSGTWEPLQAMSDPRAT